MNILGRVKFIVEQLDANEEGVIELPDTITDDLLNVTIDVLRQCAEDLDAHIRNQYEGTLKYPVMRKAYQRDMEIVDAAFRLVKCMSDDSKEETNETQNSGEGGTLQ